MQRYSRLGVALGHGAQHDGAFLLSAKCRMKEDCCRSVNLREWSSGKAI